MYVKKEKITHLTLNSHQVVALALPKVNSECGKRMFNYGIKSRNSLPTQDRNIGSGHIIDHLDLKLL